MEDIFIKNIHINKVRHLENIDIPISETERKHLILTGKNGSGKTSVLLEIKEILKLIESQEFVEYAGLKATLNHSFGELQKIEEIKNNNTSKYENELEFKNIRQLSDALKRIVKRAEQKLNNYPLVVEFNENGLNEKYENGDLILAYFEAKRKLEIKIPKGINKIEIRNKYSLEDNIGKDFLQHIVNLKADLSFAFMQNETASVNEIETWFHNFENSLKNIFDDDSIELVFDTKTYNFRIVSLNHEVSDFTTLSDGYSTILNIISELIMRMENKASKSYDIQGIVLIDEIETHLHIDLQKKILPFLTNFFPKIQFIVTTHSPFVLNSVNNAVIFDLEKKLLVEDLSGYSVNSIIESYFDSDDYSTIVKEKVIEYERLLTKENLTEDEEEKLFDLKRYFRDLPKMFSPELALKINQLALANLSVQ